jgi:Flp pilus assembly pilin Flp
MAGAAYGMTCANRRGDLFQRFYRDEAGLEMVEWVVVTLLVAIAGWVVLIEIRDTLGEVLTVVLDRFLDFID